MRVLVKKFQPKYELTVLYPYSYIDMILSDIL